MYDCNKKGIPSIKMEMKHYTRKTSNKSGWKDKFYLIEKKNLVNVTNEKLERTWFITRKMTLTNCYHKIKKKKRDIFSSDKSRWYGSMRSKIHASVRLRAILCGSNTWTVLKHLYYKWYWENNKREEKGRRQDKKAPTPTPHIRYLISPWDLKIQVSMNRTDKPRACAITQRASGWAYQAIRSSIKVNFTPGMFDAMRTPEIQIFQNSHRNHSCPHVVSITQSRAASLPWITESLNSTEWAKLCYQNYNCSLYTQQN